MHAIARAKLLEALATIKELRALLKAKDARIAELEATLADKELQRKTLSQYLYKAERKREAKSVRRPGKQPGSFAHHRTTPRPSEIMTRSVFLPRAARATRPPLVSSMV